MLKKRPQPIRVLVVEDSPTARNLLVAILSQNSAIEVIGTAQDGEDAVRQVARLGPDVVTMDVEMPRMDGLEATRRIMKTTPVPIVIVTAGFDSVEMDLSFKALQVGALTVVKKPILGDEALCAQLVQTVCLMTDVAVVRRFGNTRPLSSITGQLVSPSQAIGSPTGDQKPESWVANRVAGRRYTNESHAKRTIVGIASSTGGPSALVTALKPLPANYPLPILVVQHITCGFTAGFCEWLDSELNLQVRQAQQGEKPKPGQVLVAPDDAHLQISDHGTVLLHTSPPYKGLRPSANYLFHSLARVYGRLAAGIILTGMGDDGVDGLKELHDQGGLCISQDEETSIVFGMPREAIARKAIDHILPIENMGQALLQLPNLRLKK